MLLAALVISGMALLAWLWLWLAHGRFWSTEVRLPLRSSDDAGASWPSVGVVIPARNEAEILPETLPTVLSQDYPGRFQVFLVDDHSEDGTGETARSIARSLDQSERLTVVSAEPLEAGWTGKLWAMEQGVRAARKTGVDYLLFTDADIAYTPQKLCRLVEKARKDDLDLVSLMVRLRTATFWEKGLIPAFVYFFAMIYPFSWVNTAEKGVAAAAGGCLLARRQALENAGGLAPIAGALIDDCSLARQLKQGGRPGGGRIWLGLAQEAASLRPYDSLGEIWKMVSRTAFVQLHYSYLLLAGTLVGLALVFLVPPLAAAGGLLGLFLAPAKGAAELLLTAFGLGAWALMARTYLPMVRLYRIRPLAALTLPLAAALYTLMTLDSALRFRRGRGGLWKGRTYVAEAG